MMGKAFVLQGYRNGRCCALLSLMLFLVEVAILLDQYEEQFHQRVYLIHSSGSL